MYTSLSTYKDDWERQNIPNFPGLFDGFAYSIYIITKKLAPGETNSSSVPYYLMKGG